MLQSVLLELDVSKGVSLDGIPPLILKNCASIFARPLSLLFNNVKDYRGVARLSAIPKCFELLVYITIYDDLMNLIPVNLHIAL
jgi:hypothetical protein